MKIEITANARTEEGTGASRRLRNRGFTPGIVYGAGKPAQPIQLDHDPQSGWSRRDGILPKGWTMRDGRLQAAE